MRLRLFFYLSLFILQCFLFNCATAQKAGESVKPSAPLYISLEEDKGAITISSAEKDILLQATNATFEDILQGLADQQKMILKVYCDDPSLDSKRTTITLKSPSQRELLTQLLSPRYSISFLNQEGKPAELDKPVKKVDIYPEDCQKREHPIRTFISLKEHPVLNKPPDEITLQEISQILKKEGPSSRMGALHILGVKREKDGMPLVKEALRDANPQVVLEALKSLERLSRIYGAEEASDAIFEAIQETLYPEFLITLAQIDKERVWPVIDRFIDMKDSRGKNVAARALILTKDKKAIGYLSKIALSDDIENSRLAIWGISKIDGPEGTDALIKLLKEGDESRRIFAAQAVYFLPENERAKAQGEVDKLVKRPDVSEEMLLALAQVSFVEPFKNLLNDKDIPAKTKRKALIALATSGTEKAVDIAGLYIDDSDSNVRMEAVNLMADFATDNTIPYLVRAAEDKKPEIRKAAVNALAGLHAAEPVISALSRALDDTDEGVRRAAIDTFNLLGEPDDKMVSILENASAKSADPYVSEKALSILKLWGKDK
ncbi:MAG: HEAT repeat domain-containing protein [Nitrospirota bacterium]